MVSERFPLPLVMSVVTSLATSLVSGQEDRMPTMEHSMDLMSYTCGETTQAKQFNFVSPGRSLETPERRKVLIGEMFQVSPSV